MGRGRAWKEGGREGEKEGGRDGEIQPLYPQKANTYLPTYLP